MPRSYGSYYRQKELDKPYRGAEILLNFLGDYLETKDKTTLGYMAHEKDMEALQLARDKFELAQSESSKKGPSTAKDAYGNALVWDPNRKRYMLDTTQHLKTATTMGQGQYGTKYAKQYFNEFLVDNIVQLDTDNDGEPDKEYMGADANLYKKWSIAKNEGKLDDNALNALHPDNWLNAMQNKTNPTDKDKIEMVGYLKQRQQDQKIMSNYQDLLKMNGVSIKDDDVFKLYNTMAKNTRPKKLTARDRIDITQLLNNRNRLLAIQNKATRYERYEVSPSFNYNDETDAGGLEKVSETIQLVPFTDAMGKELKATEDHLIDFGITIMPAAGGYNAIDAPYIKME